MLVENALQYLPYIPKTVTTPVGVESHGQMLDAKASILPTLFLTVIYVEFCSTSAVCQSCDRKFPFTRQTNFDTMLVAEGVLWSVVSEGSSMMCQ
jgi:hypothetical protein